MTIMLVEFTWRADVYTYAGAVVVARCTCCDCRHLDCKGKVNEDYR